MVTPKEMALLRLAPGASLPVSGQALEVVVRSGSQTATAWTNVFGPVFHAHFGVTFWPGSLNLFADSPVTWENPATFSGAGHIGRFCPVILDDRAIGVAFQRPDPFFLEVFSPVELRPRLRIVADGQRIRIRLLSGDLLE